MTSSCICTPDRCSGHAVVRTVHAGGVQVGVGLGTGVIHVHVRVSTDLWRSFPWDLEEGKVSQNPTLFVCLFVLKLWLQWFLHLPELWGGMRWLVTVSQISQRAGWGFTQSQPEESHQDEDQGQDREDQGSCSQHLSCDMPNRLESSFSFSVTSTCRNHCVSRLCCNFLSENNLLTL